ncbi:MAG: hypothetical protein JJ854_04600 [Pseudomonadales bacterium]|nr:hypothetical protein [Pseudomonadales bacterium]
MSIAVFNINDAGIQVSVEGDLVRTSPGYAVLDGNNLLTGDSEHVRGREGLGGGDNLATI